MQIKTLPLGHLMANCHILINEDSLECVIIDPGEESNSIMLYLEQNHLKCKAILLTHGHFDHIGASIPVSEETGAPVYMNLRDLDCNLCLGIDEILLPEGVINYDDGDELEFAGYKFIIHSTPGHTAGGVCIQCEDVIFTGDTLFKNGAGRTDLHGGSMDNLMASLRKLCAIEGDFELYTGHMDNSTLDIERSNNPYCKGAMNIKQ